MQRPGRSSQEKIVWPWGRVLVLLQGICITMSLSPSTEVKLQQKEDVNYLMEHFSFQKGGPPEPVLGTQNTSFEKQCNLVSALILLCNTYFHSHLLISFKEATVFRALACCDSPLPGKAIKRSFSPSPQTLFPHFYSVPADRGQVFGNNCSSRR